MCMTKFSNPSLDFWDHEAKPKPWPFGAMKPKLKTKLLPNHEAEAEAETWTFWNHEAEALVQKASALWSRPQSRSSFVAMSGYYKLISMIFISRLCFKL